MSDLHQLTLHEALDRMDRGETSSEAIVHDLLSRIEAKDSKIQAYVHLEPERALEQARAADRARERGDKRSLLGIPIALKDVLKRQRRSLSLRFQDFGRLYVSLRRNRGGPFAGSGCGFTGPGEYG